MEVFSILEFCFHHIEENWNCVATDTCIVQKIDD